MWSKIGGGWNTDKGGISCKLDDGIALQGKFMLFQNTYKKKDNHPDWNIAQDGKKKNKRNPVKKDADTQNNNFGKEDWTENNRKHLANILKEGIEEKQVEKNRKLLEALLSETGINRNQFKDYLAEFGYLKSNGESLSMKNVPDEIMKKLVESWEKVFPHYKSWIKKKQISCRNTRKGI